MKALLSESIAIEPNDSNFDACIMRSTTPLGENPRRHHDLRVFQKWPLGTKWSDPTCVVLT